MRCRGIWLCSHVTHNGCIRCLGGAGSVRNRATHVGARVSEDDRCAKVDEFDDVASGEDTVVELEIAMCEAEGVEIGDAIAYLTEDTKYLWAEHLGGHDDGKEVVRCIFHDLWRVNGGGGLRKRRTS